MQCEFCGRVCKSINSLKQHQIRCKLNPDRIDLSYISKIPHKGRPAWNKGLNAESCPEIRKQINTFALNKEKGLHKDTSGINNSVYKPGVIDKISVAMKAVYAKNPPKVSGRSKHGRYNGIWCDSTWELAYLLYSQDHNINVVRNNTGFSYIWNNSNHTYFPDFYLPDSDTYVEIKGYCDERADAKHSQFTEKLIVLKEAELRPILEYVYDKYGKDIERLYADVVQR